MTRLLLFLLPSLATVALYLPGGLLMPARLVILALAGLAVADLVRRPGLLRSPVLLVAVGASAVIGLFGVIGLLRYGGHAASLAQWGFALLGVCAAAVLGRERRAVRALLWGWLASAGLAAVVGFWEIATARHLPGNAPAREYAGVVPGWNVISSFFDNPNLYAYHCVVVILLLPALGMTARRPLTRALPIVAAPALAVLLLWTSGRMAIIAAAVGLAVCALTRRWSRWVLAAAVAALAATIALDVPPGRQVSAAARMLIENLQWGELTSSGARLQLIRAGVWMTEQSQFLGVGPGRFADMARDPANPHVAEFTNPHFGLVELLAEYGVVSLLALVAALTAGVVLVVRVVRRPLPADAEPEQREDRTFAHAALALIVVTPLLSAMHSTWLSQPLTAVQLGTVAALLALVGTCSSRSEVEP
ncbi:O-antigen ligase family protein [Tessaracoccus defluvii]|uniref:O-antigen ligase family protein n=1 Tax=Tessaracoccus defluvii TaxID=1285901 RepID=A0A7H0H3L7_9ACTN|nr:O-antigen ligase family protein [Tessaracoccus defluvii]QNP55133.1 O-antigen ligase family protein [Tessaracoccus defluvii]